MLGFFSIGLVDVGIALTSVLSMLVVFPALLGGMDQDPIGWVLAIVTTVATQISILAFAGIAFRCGCSLRLRIFYIAMIAFVLFYCSSRIDHEHSAEYLDDYIVVNVLMVSLVSIRHVATRTLGDSGPGKILSDSSHDLAAILGKYGVFEDFGAMTVYLPIPKRESEHHAWVTIEFLHAKGLVRDPYRVPVDRVPERIVHPLENLNDERPSLYEVYRVPRNTIANL